MVAPENRAKRPVKCGSPAVRHELSGSTGAATVGVPRPPRGASSSSPMHCSSSGAASTTGVAVSAATGAALAAAAAAAAAAGACCPRPLFRDTARCGVFLLGVYRCLAQHSTHHVHGVLSRSTCMCPRGAHSHPAARTAMHRCQNLCTHPQHRSAVQQHTLPLV